MFKDLQEHNLQYQQLSDSIHSSQKRTKVFEDKIKVAKNTLQWQESRFKILKKLYGDNSTDIVLIQSPILIIEELSKQVQNTFSELCDKKVEYIEIVSTTVSQLDDILTQELSYCNQVLDDDINQQQNSFSQVCTSEYGKYSPSKQSNQPKQSKQPCYNDLSSLFSSSSSPLSSGILSKTDIGSNQGDSTNNERSTNNDNDDDDNNNNTTISTIDQYIHNIKLEIDQTLDNDNSTLLSHINNDNSPQHESPLYISHYDQFNREAPISTRSSPSSSPPPPLPPPPRTTTTITAKDHNTPPPDEFTQSQKQSHFISKLLSQKPTPTQLKQFDGLNMTQLHTLYDKLYHSLQHLFINNEILSLTELIYTMQERMVNLQKQLIKNIEQSDEFIIEKKQKENKIKLTQLNSKMEQIQNKIPILERKILGTQKGIQIKTNHLEKLYLTVHNRHYEGLDKNNVIMAGIYPSTINISKPQTLKKNNNKSNNNNSDDYDPFATPPQTHDANNNEKKNEKKNRLVKKLPKNNQ